MSMLGERIKELEEALRRIGTAKYGLQGIMEDYNDPDEYNLHAMEYFSKLCHSYEAIARKALKSEAPVKSVIQEPKWFVVICISNNFKENLVGYRATLISANNKHEAIGKGSERLTKLNPGLILSTFECIEISDETKKDSLEHELQQVDTRRD